MFKKSFEGFGHKKFDNYQGQCYIPLVISIKLCLKEKMGYPKKHRGRRKQGSKKRRAKRKNKKK